MSPVVPAARPSRTQALMSAPHRGLLTLAAGLIVRLRNRRTAASLLHADARLLADIGLTRADVAAALRPPFSDPSADFGRIAEERRGTARALVRQRLAEAACAGPA
jgi:uncharacterized protein YjiS (DUF1127 family)